MKKKKKSHHVCRCPVGGLEELHNLLHLNHAHTQTLWEIYVLLQTAAYFSKRMLTL